jgi:hypothetical protein
VHLAALLATRTRFVRKASVGCRPQLPRWPWRASTLACRCLLLETMGDLRLSLFAYRLYSSTHARVMIQTERGRVESQHARGLTIQLSQGQGRQPLRPEGAPPAAGVPRSHGARAFDCGGRRQDTMPERCVSTEKMFLFCCVVPASSLDLSYQTLALSVRSIPAWL